jgi:cardiolipin synthase (CMP-forming)
VKVESLLHFSDGIKGDLSMTRIKKEYFNIPNLLSYLRLLLIPAFVVVFLSATSQRDYYIAALIVLFSALTDLLDGIIARKFGQITELGKVLDPIADKLTQITIIICLLNQYTGMWAVILLFMIKELSMVINGLVLLKKGKKLDGAKWFGKWSTAVFFVCMILLVAMPKFPGEVAASLMIIASVFLLLSFVMYGREYAKMYQASREEKQLES